MLAFPHSIRIFVAVAPVDMRQSFNGLWTAASERLQEDPRTHRTKGRMAAGRRLRVRAVLTRTISKLLRNARMVFGLTVPRVSWPMGFRCWRERNGSSSRNVSRYPLRVCALRVALHGEVVREKSLHEAGSLFRAHRRSRETAGRFLAADWTATGSLETYHHVELKVR